MSERKVLNKYYPPDYDPSKLPKLKLEKNRQYVIRVMAPFNMKCNTCGEYIYKGRKFNARRETVQDETYLGLWIFRFYIRCTRCISEISFKTDLKNCDYACEHGATRLFEAEKLARENAEKEAKDKADESLNPMKVLENRTKDSRKEMAIMESLEELKELNSRQAGIYELTDKMLEMHQTFEEKLRQKQVDEEEEMVQAVLRGDNDSKNVEPVLKRLEDSESDEEDGYNRAKIRRVDKPTDLLTEESTKDSETKVESWQKSVGSMSAVSDRGKIKSGLAGLVKRKTGKQDIAKTCDTPAPSSSTGKSTSSQPQTSTGLGLLTGYDATSSSDSDT